VMNNPAFLELIGAGSQAQVKGQALSRWVAGFDQQLDGVLNVINRNGIATRSTSVLIDDDEASAAVELSAALLTGGEQLHIGITLRRRTSRSDSRHEGHDLGEKIRRLVTQFGQLSLDQLLARVGELAEQQFVQQALAHTDGDQTAAARLLRVNVARLREQSARPIEAGRGDGEPTLH